jgi:hypothetical protein
MMVTLTLLGLLACTGDENGFGNSTYEAPDDTNDSKDTEDTGEVDSLYPDGWPDPYDANGPSLGTFDAWFDEFGNIGDVIYVSVDYFDPQDDLLDGRFKVWIESEQGDVDGSADGDIKETTAAGAEGWLEDTNLVFVISVEDEWQNYHLKIRAWDKNNNRSNDVEGWMGPD